MFNRRSCLNGCQQTEERCFSGSFSASWHSWHFLTSSWSFNLFKNVFLKPAFCLKATRGRLHWLRNDFCSYRSLSPLTQVLSLWSFVLLYVLVFVQQERANDRCMFFIHWWRQMRIYLYPEPRCSGHEEKDPGAKKRDQAIHPCFLK